MNTFSELISQLEKSPEQCSKAFSAFNRQMMSETSAGFATPSLRPDALRLIEDSWRARLRLHQSLQNLQRKGRLEFGCYSACRDSFRIMRSVEDHLGEWLLTSENTPQSDSPKHRAWTGSFPHVLARESANIFEIEKQLRSGDVLISRGNAYTSAAISRLGDATSQFSHMALIYIDPGTRQIHTIEAHIEVGVVTAPFEKYLTDGKVRSALYRYPDAKRAERAAKMMFELANQSTTRGANIPYDFKMDINNRDELHCSEVIDYAFELADPKAATIPTFLNSFVTSSSYFMSRLGISAKTSFVPGDLEVDPQFDLIAEWRHFPAMADTRYKDAVLMSMYDWMNRFGYEFKTSTASQTTRKWIWAFRRWPLLGKLLQERFPLNMPRQTLLTILAMDDAAEVLHVAAESIDKEHKRLAGISLNLPSLIRQLDLFRQRDLLNWIHEAKIVPNQEFRSRLGITVHSSSPQDAANAAPAFHHFFAPNLGIAR